MNKNAALGLLFLALTSGANSGFAQTTLDGLPRVADWTDLETTSNEMPSNIWGTCDVQSADRVGLRVEFDDGTTASAVYSGVSGVWNSSFDPITAGVTLDSSTGFLASCPGLHFLYNNNTNLPAAWSSCSAPAASNFDLDYNESAGSHFRADAPGWTSARFQTYCGTALSSSNATSVPTLPLAFFPFLALIIGYGVRKKLK